MKRLLLVVCGVVVACSCGGGAGGGGSTTPPATPSAIIVSIVPQTRTNIDQGQTVKFTATLINDSSAKGVTWSVTGAGGTSAAWGTLTDTTTSSATYNAPAAVSSSVSITVTATSVADTTRSGSAVVVVSLPPSITATTLTNATPNASYAATLQATGGTGTLTWSLAGGALPTGLTLGSSGAISGIPTDSGTSTFTAQVTDSSGAAGGPDSAQAHFSLSVVTALSISTTALPAGSQGVTYLANVTASGGTAPYTWSIVAGSLPPGLSMQASSGAISGSPSSPGSYTFTVAAKDSSPAPQTQTHSFAITIAAAGTLIITTPSLTNATPNATYSATLQAQGGVGTFTWSLASGALPTGLSLSGSGIISGVPTVSGTANFTVQVTDSSTAAGGPDSAQQQLSLTVVTALTLSTTALPTGSQGVTYLANVNASGGTDPYTWSIVTGSLPPGLAMQASSGAISGSPSSAGNFIFTVAAKDSSPTPQTQTRSFAIAVSPAATLTITTSSLANATPNANYTATLRGTGGVGMLAWSLAGGVLPTGLSLSGSGTISGIPTVSGASNFTVQVTDSSTATGGPDSAQEQLSLTIVTVVSISTTALPAGSQGVTYLANVNASGGTAPYLWSIVTGSLPSGLAMQSGSGAISGSPSSPGNFTFTMAAKDSSPTPQSRTHSFVITIAAAGTLIITSPSLTNATPNTTYNTTLQAQGGVGTLTWSLAGGVLPTGLSLSGSGVISGVPTVSGTSNFTVQVTDSSTATGGPDSVQKQLSLTIITAVSITTTTLPAGSQGIFYLGGLVASGGTPPYTWSVSAGSLPPGLAMQSGSGAISGSPSSPGKFTFTVAAKDSSPTPQTQTQSLAITVAASATLTITTRWLINATPNANYAAALQATGGVGALTWSLASGALPMGLSLSSAGVISGDPTAPGNFNLTAQVTDSSTAAGGPDSAQAQLNLTVVTLVSIATTALPAGSQGETYLTQVSASGGTSPYTWSVSAGALPPGLTIQASSGVISGSPTAQGNFTFTVAATDSSPTPQTQTQSLAIPIGAPWTLAITTSALLDGNTNSPYTAAVAVTGGTPPYSWSVAAGTLPAGLFLNAATGTIAGSPSSTGTANFTVTVTDASSTIETRTRGLSITVDGAAEACTSSGSEAALSGPYGFSLSGFNDVGFLTVVGSFTADGAGRITAGEADTDGVLGAQHANVITSASSYSVGSDHRGCATLATPFGTFVTHFAVGSMSAGPAANGQAMEWDSPSGSAYIAAGQLLRQNAGAFAGGLSGSYVFHTAGWDNSALGGRDVCVGMLNAGNNSLTGLEEDCNDAWTISNLVEPNAGNYTIVDANGRGTGTIALGDANSNIAFYVVSPTQLLVVSADGAPALSGEWDQQSVPAGGAGFTQASLSGSMVFYLNGLSLGGTATNVSFETANADGNSSMAIKFYEDRAGTMQISGTYTCTYAVEPSGRVTLSSSSQSCGGIPPVFYLTGLNSGFILDAASGVDAGSVEPQSAGPFNNASISGSFFGGMTEVVMQSAQTEVDPVAADGSGNFAGTADMSSMSSQSAGSSFSAVSYTVNSDGTFSIGSSGGAVAGVIVSSTRFVMFSPSTLATSLPTLLVMQQ